MAIMEQINTACHLCGSEDYTVLRKVTSRPEKETNYGIGDNNYYREICECKQCKVYFNRHADLISDDFYEGHYNSSIKMGTLIRRYNKIIEFPFGQSDNKNRVSRVIQFLYSQDLSPVDCRVLDVGAGTNVFLHEMKKFGCTTVCIDPDPASAQHALENVKVDEAFAGTLDDFETNIPFQLISFNKVLEHVKNPIEILKQAKSLLADGKAYIYVELPNGSPSIEQGNMVERSEFFLEHYTTFNAAAYTYLVQEAGLKIEKMGQITDPSGKFTIFGFLSR